MSSSTRTSEVSSKELCSLLGISSRWLAAITEKGFVTASRTDPVKRRPRLYDSRDIMKIIFVLGLVNIGVETKVIKNILGTYWERIDYLLTWRNTPRTITVYPVEANVDVNGYRYTWQPPCGITIVLDEIKSRTLDVLTRHPVTRHCEDARKVRDIRDRKCPACLHHAVNEARGVGCQFYPPSPELECKNFERESEH